MKRKNIFTQGVLYVVQFIPLGIMFCGIGITAWLTTYIFHGETEFFLRIYIGEVLLTFGVLKYINFEEFKETFKKYDLVAAHVSFYPTIFPLIEIALGIGFLLGYGLTYVIMATVILATVNILSIITAIVMGKKVTCACMGGLFKIPLTRASVIENIIIYIIALTLLY